jgi:hypothetical protein
MKEVETKPQIDEYQSAVLDVAKALKRYEQRVHGRESIAGASTEELVSLWRDLRRAHLRFQSALPPFYSAIRVLNSLN